MKGRSVPLEVPPGIGVTQLGWEHLDPYVRQRYWQAWLETREPHQHRYSGGTIAKPVRPGTAVERLAAAVEAVCRKAR